MNYQLVTLFKIHQIVTKHFLCYHNFLHIKSLPTSRAKPRTPIGQRKGMHPQRQILSLLSLAERRVLHKGMLFCYSRGDKRTSSLFKYAFELFSISQWFYANNAWKYYLTLFIRRNFHLNTKKQSDLVTVWVQTVIYTQIVILDFHTTNTSLVGFVKYLLGFIVLGAIMPYTR